MKIKYLCCQTAFGPLVQNAAVIQRNNYALSMNKNNYENEYLHLSKLEFRKKKFPTGDQGGWGCKKMVSERVLISLHEIDLQHSVMCILKENYKFNYLKEK